MARCKVRQLVDAYTYDKGSARKIVACFSGRIRANNYRKDEGGYSFFDIPSSETLSFLKSQESAMPYAEY